MGRWSETHGASQVDTIEHLAKRALPPCLLLLCCWPDAFLGKKESKLVSTSLSLLQVLQVLQDLQASSCKGSEAAAQADELVVGAGLD